MFKTESRNGECNGHAHHAPAPRKKPARRKLPSPPCPHCSDRLNIFSRIDKPDELFCFVCSKFFSVKDVKKLVAEWTDFLGNHPSE